MSRLTQVVQNQTGIRLSYGNHRPAEVIIDEFEYPSHAFLFVLASMSNTKYDGPHVLIPNEKLRKSLIRRRVYVVNGTRGYRGSNYKEFVRDIKRAHRAAGIDC